MVRPVVQFTLETTDEQLAKRYRGKRLTLDEADKALGADKWPVRDARQSRELDSDNDDDVIDG
jgi:hypothetical protein